MRKPVILTVDDDPEVLHAISQDVRREYGEHFRVVRVDSGERALEVLRKVKLANEPVALMLVDQRMPGMTGVDFLVEARKIYPDSKGALLTAYADTDAAIKAINDVRLDYYLMKPWDPPEDRLFPVLDDLLEDWQGQYKAPFEGIRLIGHRWSAESHQVRDFLARNQVPFKWLDAIADESARELMALAGADERSLPVVVFDDGAVLVSPTAEALAERIGLRGKAEVALYDVIIVGAGPAGLAAAVYAASEGLRACLLERFAPGGQAGTSSRIENYLGFPSGLSGSDLARRALTQAQRFGAELLLTRSVSGLTVNEGSVGVRLEDGTELSALSLIVATGVSYRRLDVPGAEALTGRGVYYGAAATEAASLKGEDVYIVGGANSAGQAAIHFAQVAKSVTMLVRGPGLSATMSHYLIERIERTENITVMACTAVDEVIGDEHLQGIVIRRSDTGEKEQVATSALFVFIGASPHTEWLGDAVLRDPQGFVLTGPDVIQGAGKAAWRLDRDPFLLETSVPGVFAAGDVRHGSGKRVSTAVGEGSMAIMSVWQHRAHAGI